MTIVGKLKISPHVEKFQMSPHDRCGEIWNSPHMACVWCRKRRHKCQIYCNLCRFVAKSVIRAVLSRNFMWRKIEPKSTFVEKKWQIWGLVRRAYNRSDQCMISDHSKPGFGLSPAPSWELQSFHQITSNRCWWPLLSWELQEIEKTGKTFLSNKFISNNLSPNCMVLHGIA